MHKLVTFFLLAFLISWLIWLPQYGDVLGMDFTFKIPFNHALGGLGPMLAAIITTSIYDKSKTGQLFKSMFRNGNVIMLLIAIFAPFIIALLSILCNGIVTGNYENPQVLLRNNEFPQWSFIGFAMYNFVFFGLGEETGWRGFALPELQKKFKPLPASLVLTLFWATWHWPLFFYRPGYVTMGWAGIAGWVFSLFTGSILLTWIYNNSRRSILVCAVFHATIDIIFTAAYADKNITNCSGFFITVWGVTTAYLLTKHKSGY